MTGWYLGALAFSFAGVVTIDARWKVALFARERRARALTVAVTLVGAAGFLVWDAVAISRGFFGRGESRAMLGVEVAPHLPVEELVFVTFLSYLTLVVFGGALRLLGQGTRPTPEVRS
ncbi:lycopene cyclase domain-containing protein [Flavimobilis soli]|uniref:Lycopene cyclase domain-containing protein n=1 Tax=Flavimobilis soli TaxID=442709 RepID=A0A2A9ECF9_9MICO|nr:lycopene cyclase domain-containing protein [Flavimobilis soli]PFG36747.1 lycopene cyclase domain-containing protein [Flavimobilis soli]